MVLFHNICNLLKLLIGIDFRKYLFIFFLKLIAFFLVFIFNPYQGYSQKYIFKHFEIPDGLPHPYIYTLNQGLHGFLWIGTAEGLCKYDGKTFVNYTSADGLADNFVNSSLLDKENRLWIGHYQGGITLFDNKNFVPIKDGTLPTSRINNFFESKDGNIWVCTQSEGLFIIDKNLSIDTVSGINTDEIIWDIAQINKSQMLLATNEGLRIYNYVSHEVKTVKELDGIQVVCLNSKNENTFIIGTEFDGLFELKFFINEYKLKKLVEKGSSTKEKLVFTELDAEGNLWISRFETGITRNKLTKDSIIHFDSYNKDNGLKYNYFKSLLKDREGNLWIGSFGNGLYQLNNQVFTIFNSENGLPDNSVNCVSFHDDYIYAGFNKGITKHYTGDDFSTTLRMPGIDKLQNKRIHNIFFDSEGYGYFSVVDEGIYRQDPKNKTVERWFYIQNSLLSNKVNDITQDHDGNIWIATEFGAYCYEKETKNFIHHTMEQGLAHNIVFFIYVDSRNTVWFATHGSGISRFLNGSIQTLPSPISGNAIDINSITEDKKGNLWFGSYGQGVFKYDKNCSLLKILTRKDGLGSNFCYTLMVDAKNNLLIGHKNGITKISLSTDKISFINNSEMLQGAEVNLNAIAVDHNKCVWYGTNKGLLKFDPSKDRINTKEPIINLTSIKIFFKTQDWKKLNYNSGFLSPPADIKFRHNNNHITFNFIGVCLTAPEKVRYKYLLQGFDNTWSIETDETYTTYSNLPPGEYQFKLLAMNNDGIWTSFPMTYNFKIDSPYWKTTWFYLTVFIILFTIIYGIFIIRTRSLHRQKRILELEKIKLENEIHERKITEHKLKESQQLLKVTNDELNTLIWRSYHDLRGPSITIQGLVKVALLDDNKHSMDTYLSMIQKTAQKLDTILRDFFQVSDIKNMQLKIEKIDFQTCIDEVISNLSENHNCDNYKLETTIQVMEPFFSDKSLISLIFYNIINNSMCYSDENNTIEIIIKQYKKNVTILIVDHGYGIPEVAQKRVFEMFYRASVKSKGNGLGLYVTKKIVEILKSSIHIFSNENRGTTVLLKLKNSK